MSDNVKEQVERKKTLVDVPKTKRVIPATKSISKGKQLITEKWGKK